MVLPWNVSMFAYVWKKCVDNLAMKVCRASEIEKWFVGMHLCNIWFRPIKKFVFQFNNLYIEESYSNFVRYFIKVHSHGEKKASKGGAENPLYVSPLLFLTQHLFIFSIVSSTLFSFLLGGIQEKTFNWSEEQPIRQQIGWLLNSRRGCAQMVG